MEAPHQGPPPVGCPIFADGGAVGQTAAEGMFVVVGSHSERGNKTTTTTTTTTTATTLTTLLHNVGCHAGKGKARAPFKMDKHPQRIFGVASPPKERPNKRGLRPQPHPQPQPQPQQQPQPARGALPGYCIGDLRVALCFLRRVCRYQPWNPSLPPSFSPALFCSRAPPSAVRVSPSSLPCPPTPRLPGRSCGSP